MSKPIMNPPSGRGDEATLIAVLAPIIARLCAVPAPVIELPHKPTRRKQR
jgi:hypothetical protein